MHTNTQQHKRLNEHISTQQIAQNFAKAHATYAKSAVVQERMCHQLLAMMTSALPHMSPQSILEIGCGVGTLTKLYTQLWTPDRLYLNDLYEIRPHVQAQLLIGDIEKMDLPMVDMVLSSSALQWMKDLPHLFECIYQALSSDGVFAFASFGKDNLKEIKALTGVGLEYHGLDEIVTMLRQSGFHVIANHQGRQVLYFDDAKEVLRHIKETGVSVGGRAWTKSSLRAFYDDYASMFATEQGYPVSYDTLFVVACKSCADDRQGLDARTHTSG